MLRPVALAAIAVQNDTVTLPKRDEWRRASGQAGDRDASEG
jgi:hypothetical protein